MKTLIYENVIVYSFSMVIQHFLQMNLMINLHIIFSYL